MVVIGGTGTRWGAVLGGIVYTFLDNRLLDWSDSQFIQDLPKALRIPLSEPLFVLGTLFILLVYFLPGGLAGLARLRPRRSGVAAPRRDGRAPAPSSPRRRHAREDGAPARHKRRRPDRLRGARARRAAAPDARPRLRPLGLGAGPRRVRGRLPRPLLRQPRDRRERRPARAVHGARSSPRTPSPCSTRPGSSGRTSSARASAGWPRRSSRWASRSGSTGSCSRARRRAARSSHPMPQQTVELMAAAPTLAPEVALRRFVENALAPGAPDELVERIYALRLANPFDPQGWQAQAAAGATLRRARPARRDRGADARRHGHRGRRRRPAQLGAARRADPGRAAGARRRAATCSSGRIRRGS